MIPEMLDLEAFCSYIRISLLGWLSGRIVHMTYTERGEDLHVISLREASKYEARQYFQALSDEP